MRTTTPKTESAGRGAGRGEGLVGGAADGGCVACKSGTNGAADFDRHLRRFFWRAAGVSRRDPGLALLFARAAVRQRKAAARRRGWRQQGVQTQPLLFMSITRRGGLRGAAEIHEALAEAADLGVAVVVLGGEPLACPELLDIAGRFSELMFILVTDGSLLEDAVLVKLERYRNIIPVLSLDPVEAVTAEWRGHGAYGRVTATMAEMKARRLFFGVSITITRGNFPLTTSRVFVRDLVKRGCRLVSYADYVPIETGTERMAPTATQRKAVPLTLDLLRKEFPALFFTSAASGQTEGRCTLWSERERLESVLGTAAGRATPCGERLVA